MDGQSNNVMEEAAGTLATQQQNVKSTPAPQNVFHLEKLSIHLPKGWGVIRKIGGKLAAHHVTGTG